jgi:hypothetical protein
MPKKPQQQLAKLSRPRLHMAMTRGLVTGAYGHVTAGEASRLRAVRHSPALCSMLLGNSRFGGAPGRSGMSRRVERAS